MKKKVIATTLVTVVLVAGILFTVNGCADKNTDSSQTANTETRATITDADTTDKESVDVADADTGKDTDASETVKADTAKTGKTKDDSDKEPATQAPATTETPETQAPAPSTQAPTTQAPRTEEPTTAHQHTWTTVVDKDEWDEPIYEEQDVYEWHCRWPDGTLADELQSCEAKQRWCMLHCTRCNPECSNPDPAGRCAFTILDGTEWVGTEKVQVGTRHHDAVTHQECSTCGARK